MDDISGLRRLLLGTVAHLSLFAVICMYVTSSHHLVWATTSEAFGRDASCQLDTQGVVVTVQASMFRPSSFDISEYELSGDLPWSEGILAYRTATWWTPWVFYTESDPFGFAPGWTVGVRYELLGLLTGCLMLFYLFRRKRSIRRNLLWFVRRRWLCACSCVCAAIAFHVAFCSWSFSTNNYLTMKELAWPDPTSRELLDERWWRVCYYVRLKEYRDPQCVHMPLEKSGNTVLPLSELSDDAISVLAESLPGKHRTANARDLILEKCVGEMPRSLHVMRTEGTRERTESLTRFYRSHAAIDADPRGAWTAWLAPQREDARLSGWLYCGPLTAAYTQPTGRHSLNYRCVYWHKVAWGFGCIVPACLMVLAVVSIRMPSDQGHGSSAES